MFDHEVAGLRAACDTFAVPIPAAVIAAEKFVAVCRAAQATIDAEADAAPLPLTAKERDVHAWIAARLDAGRHDARVSEAVALVTRADGAVRDAWTAAAPALFASFRAAFDRAATDLLAALDGTDDLGLPGSATYQRAADACHRLGSLERVHEMLTSNSAVADRLDGNILRWLRLFRVPDRDTWARLGVRTSGHPRHSPGWYAAILATGARPRWATLAEITAEWAASAKADALA
jgi:hypothetical protein